MEDVFFFLDTLGDFISFVHLKCVNCGLLLNVNCKCLLFFLIN